MICIRKQFKYWGMVCWFRPYKATKGFLNYTYFSLKFEDHAEAFKIKSELDYARRADALFAADAVPLKKNRPPRGTVEYGFRAKDKAWLRYNNDTKEFGVLDQDNYLRNYYPATDRQYILDQCFNR